jgi:hypothetical protein
MNLRIRKFVVGLVALVAMIGVYLLYVQMDRTPPIVADLSEPPPPVVDVNRDPQSTAGTIAGVGIGQVEETRFVHRNERNRIDRVFGFHQLLHKQGNQWEITNPYMELYLPTFQCTVTANRGRVQVETAFSRPMASDARFSGNVIIHIAAAEPNDALECFIHLDDVEFVAAKSLFSTIGVVRFLSRRARLTGTGMDLLYDEGHSRLELFRIFTLDSLRLRSRELGSMADLTPSHPPRPGATAPSPEPNTPVGPSVAGTGPATPPVDRYQCLFHGNVVIDMPERVITARDDLAIDNILWSSSKNLDAVAQPAADSNDANAPVPSAPKPLNTAGSSYAALSSIPPESYDTAVTCNGGLEVTLMGTKLKIERREPKTEETVRNAADAASSSVAHPASSGTSARQHATAQRINFNVVTTDTTLAGPVEMMFPLDPNGFPAARVSTKALPMTITARKDVRFLAAANQIIFEEDCKVVASRSEPNLTYEYILAAPRLVLDVASDPNQGKKGSVDARRLVTDGGPASLRILRKSPDKLLGSTVLDAVQLQYSASPRQFMAIGPGEIRIRNDEMLDAKADPNQFSLGRPCIVRLTNFDTLRYFADTNRIIAENEAQQLRLDYVPLVDGKYTRYTRTVAGHVEATLKEITKGHLDLATLTATHGIDYEDETAGLSFVGSTLSYDYSQSLVAVRGDSEQPCSLNGALVPQIDLNLKTGRIETGISGPSVFRVRR